MIKKKKIKIISRKDPFRSLPWFISEPIPDTELFSNSELALINSVEKPKVESVSFAEAFVYLMLVTKLTLSIVMTGLYITGNFPTFIQK
jgi:hypothetical protein